MGQLLKFKCKECDSEFEWSDGGGFAYNILHCDKCGKEKKIKIKQDISTADENIINCKCGGKYLLNAPTRCPKCKAINKLDDGVLKLLYD